MRPTTVAMVQSNHVPWKGYFDRINMADRFVFYDIVQFAKEDWRNRKPDQDQVRPEVALRP